MIIEKINNLRNKFKKYKIEGYIVPKNDDYFSEYAKNDRLKKITKFSGSAGLAVILNKKNYLFVDGRYTLQAYNQASKFFTIITFPNKMPYDILKNKKLIIGFDPKLFTKNIFSIFFGKNNCRFKPINNNLIDKIWKRKKEISKSYFYQLPNSSKSENYK